MQRSLPTGVADLNGDGKPDIVGFATTGLGVLINTTIVASTTGAVNGASFVTGGPLTGGSIASIFGSGFPSANTYASVIPLLDNLDGVSVTIGGFPAPLLFVGPKQINLQVPWDVSGTMADVVVTVNGTPLAPYPASIAAALRPFSPPNPVLDKPLRSIRMGRWRVWKDPFPARSRIRQRQATRWLFLPPGSVP